VLRNKRLATLLLAFATLGSAGASAQPQFIQVNFNNIGTSTLTLPFSANVGAGNLIVAAANWNGAGTMTVTDNHGYSYSVAGPSVSSPTQTMQIFYLANAPGGATTLTYNAPGTNYIEVNQMEYSGVALTNVVDNYAGAQSTSTTAMSPGPVNVTAPNDLVVAWCTAIGVTAGTPGFTSRSTANGNLVEDAVISTTGTVNTTATASSALWEMETVAFFAYVDAGPGSDAGATPDGGSADAGVTDAGVAAGGPFTVGCGCTAGAPAVLPALGALIAALALRRIVRSRHPA
jgi:hypothetical protein